MANIEQLQIQQLQNDVSDLKAELAQATRAYNQMSLTLHQKLLSNEDTIQQVLSEVHNDYVVLANGLDSLIRLNVGKFAEGEEETLLTHLNSFLNRG